LKLNYISLEFSSFKRGSKRDKMKQKGSRVERELVKMLWDADCAAMRAPSSGGATKKATSRYYCR